MDAVLPFWNAYKSHEFSAFENGYCHMSGVPKVRVCSGDFGGQVVKAALPPLTGNRGEYSRVVIILVMIENEGRYL